ncbi:hypothetical protein B0H14DRAFT_3157506 [Mycena olivaceomarginata]|nr:hypothetical protein B0H14DRAFT_3157506 [Mycena olivaceomarginata]
MLPSIATQNRLENVVTGLTMATNTLEIIADSIQTPFLGAIINTTQAVLKNIQLLEQIHKLLTAIMILHIKSDVGGEMPVEVLDHVGKFTEYWSCLLDIHYTLTTEIRILHKIYTFLEAQQKGNRVKSFFRQGELSTLLKDCQAGLQQSFDFFQIEETRAIILDITEMKKNEQKRHQEVLDMIEKLSEGTASERASTISGHHYLSSKPKIFHGRESELSDILHLFNTGVPRIAILGTGGMGKTSLARAVLHHPDITARYVQNRFFVACNSATTKVELANLIGSHLGLKPGKDLTQAVLQHFSNNPPSLLILDELETLWEPESSRVDIEELLSLLTDSAHSLEEVDQILSLADNMPLAISLLAHLADTEGCSSVLSRWEKEKTSLISEGFDKRSNLDLCRSHPKQLPLENMLQCKTTLKSTALAYSDEHKRLKLLMPIREYLQQHLPPSNHLVLSLLTYFQEMLNFYIEYHGTQPSSGTIARIKLNLMNIQNVLRWGLKQKEPVLSNSIYCICHLIQFSWGNMQVRSPLIGQIQDLLPQVNDHQLKAYFLIESTICLWKYHPISDPEALASQVVELFKDFDNADLKCRFYRGMAGYYTHVKNDLGEATNMCKKLISLASRTGNIRRHKWGLFALAWISIRLGTYSVAQMYAYECQKLSSVSGYLYGEAEAAHLEAICWKELGDFKKSLSLSIRAQSLLSLCGMAGSETSLGIINIQAEVHRCKSEYNLYIREKDLLAAKRLLEKSLTSIEHNEIKSFCFERLGNTTAWGADETTPHWTTIFLIHSLKLKAKLQVYKALQFMGQMFLTHKDENTAVSLFTVALVGFTYMDVHQSRADCMIRLGDISSRRGDLLKAVELWESARPLFERSSQVKEVQYVDERLSHVGSNVLDHHRENIAHLVRLDVPFGNSSNIKDEEQVEFIGEPLNRLTIPLWDLMSSACDLDFYNATLKTGDGSVFPQWQDLSDNV